MTLFRSIDIPEEVAGQLGNRIQHALRAYTPRDQRAIKAAAETFRINPKLDVETAITELKVGEALVSVLQEDGAPSPVQRSEEHTSELQSLMRISYAVFCLKKKKKK